jgi:hypothetical protein
VRAIVALLICVGCSQVPQGPSPFHPGARAAEIDHWLKGKLWCRSVYADSRHVDYSYCGYYDRRHPDVRLLEVTYDQQGELAEVEMTLPQVYGGENVWDRFLEVQSEMVDRYGPPDTALQNGVAWHRPDDIVSLRYEDVNVIETHTVPPH